MQADARFTERLTRWWCGGPGWVVAVMLPLAGAVVVAAVCPHSVYGASAVPAGTAADMAVPADSGDVPASSAIPEAAAPQAASRPVAAAPPPLIHATVVPVQSSSAEPSPLGGFDWGVGVGFAALGSIDGHLRRVGRDLGMPNPPGPALIGMGSEVWLAPARHARVNLWWLQLGGTRTAAFAPASVSGGDREQTLTTTLRGGGIGARYVLPLKRGVVWGGGDFGLAGLHYALERTRLGGAGSYEALVDALADAAVVETYRRDLSTGGPLLRAALGGELVLGRWLALGLQAGYVALLTPEGQWVDNNTGENLARPPFKALQSWDVRAQLIAGAVTRR